MSTVIDDLLLAAAPAGGLLARRDMLRRGVSSGALARAVRARRLVRVGRGVYAAQPIPPRPRWLVTEDGLAPEHVLAVRVVLLELPGAAATGRTGALLRGWELWKEPRKHELAVEHGRSTLGDEHEDVLVRQTRRLRVLDAVPVTGGAPVPVVAADDLVVEALLALPALEAVVLADSAMRAGHVTMEELLARAAALPGRRQVARARSLLEWCDPESGSVLESVLRFLMHRDGITGFRTQRVLSRNGKRVLRTDFSFALQRLVVEADGTRWHDGETDRLADNQLVAGKWRVMRLTWDDVVNDPNGTLALIREALDDGLGIAA